MPSALEIAGSAHRATSPAFKLHAALACVQIALVTWICRAADIWRSKRTSEQFPGHLGPSVFIAAIGVSALTAEWPWRQRSAIEGKLSMWGGGSCAARVRKASGVGVPLTVTILRLWRNGPAAPQRSTSRRLRAHKVHC